MDNQALIRDALSALLVRTNDDAYVIIEHQQSGKFVQFAGPASELLLLDLPWQTLSETEFDRAVEFFRRLGIVGAEHDVFDEPGGRVVSQQFSFNMTIQTVDEASRIALDVLQNVFQIPRDCDLVITES